MGPHPCRAVVLCRMCKLCRLFARGERGGPRSQPAPIHYNKNAAKVGEPGRPPKARRAGNKGNLHAKIPPAPQKASSGELAVGGCYCCCYPRLSPRGRDADRVTI